MKAKEVPAAPLLGVGFLAWKILLLIQPSTHPAHLVTATG